MSVEPASGCVTYDLRVRLDITATLDIPIAEVGGLVIDGLFALDDQGLLFPGITIPDGPERLVNASVHVEGYSRPSVVPPVNKAFEKLMGRRRVVQPPKESDLLEAVDNAVILLVAMQRQQRMFVAQMSSVAAAVRAEEGDAGHSVKTAGRAKTLLAAVGRLVECFDTEIRPVM